MDDSGSLATPPSERNRVFDVIDNTLLQVNYPWCGSREENSQERRRGCGMWAPESPRCDYSLANPVGLLPCAFFTIGSMLGYPYFAISPDIAFSPTSIGFSTH